MSGPSRRGGWRGVLFRALKRASLRAGALQERLGRRPAVLAAVLAAATAALAPGLARLRIDNRIEVWTGQAEEAGPGRPSFPERDFIAVVRRGVEGSSRDFIAEDRRLRDRLGALDGVADVECVSTMLDRLGSASIGELGDGARFFEGYLLSRDRRSAIQRLWLREGLERRRVVADVERALQGVVPRPVLLGPAVFNAALDDRSRAESTRVFPLAVGALTALLVALHRSFRTALCLLGMAALGTVWFLGLAGWCGISLNLVTVNVPVIGLVAGLTLAIHPVHAALAARRPAGGRLPSLRRVALIAQPGGIVSIVTTAAGFSTLCLGAAPAVREFGALTALAVAVAAAAVFWAFPLTALLLPRVTAGSPASPVLDPAWPALLGRFAARAGRSMPLWVSLACAPCLLAAATISIDHRPLDFLAAGDPLREEYRRAEGEIDGLAPLEFLVELPGTVYEPGNARLLEKTAAAMACACGTDRAFSFVEPVKLAASRLRQGAGGSYRLPGTDLELAAVLAAVKALPGAAQGLVDASGRTCRVFLPLNPIGGAEFAAVRARVERTAAAVAGVAPLSSGLIDRLMRIQDRILEGQASSLILGLLGNSLVLGAVLGTRREALAAAAVNILPLVFTAGAMGLGRIPLDLSTSMVASVALGIAVDDTAHFLWTHGTLSRRRSDPAARTLAEVGPSIFTNSVVLAAGFAALGAAGFPPIARFGLLTAGTLVLSLAGHLLVLPALLSRARRGSAPFRNKARVCLEQTS